MLELWNQRQGIDQTRLIGWLKEDSKNRGVVIDTAKIDSWLISNDLEDQKAGIIQTLLPHTFEVHYRVKGKYNRRVQLDGVGELSEKSTDNLKRILDTGYQDKVVVESGWPDVDIPQNESDVISLHANLLNFIARL